MSRPKRFSLRSSGRPRGAPVPAKPPRRIRARVRALRERFLFNREMRLRLMSAAVLIPIVITTAYLGGIPFLLLALIIGAAVFYEWLAMVGAGGMLGPRLTGWAALAGIAVLAHMSPLPVALAAVAIACGVTAAVGTLQKSFISLRWLAAGMLYSGLAVVSLVALRKGADGFGAVIFVFLIAWASDTMAFFVGRKVGGPKLWPSVSPSKTWSGAVGGFVAAIVFGAVVGNMLGVPFAAGTLIAAGLVAIGAQSGDLIESAAKRRFSIKDAGTLIPGHGGVMDRVDGLIVSALISVLMGSIVAFWVSAATPAAGLLHMMGMG
ncbi:phosphatidate cytidylyltransferase [Acuticoccus sp. MNP-M23]|uniref:phosphatidate cytidylyltransferase n=1 Tax=Acuticoccus sp. MNP-M23 TaxID=3072793 RepID=UPI0028151A79|nr:phosphatidate cytidylyltransferase [Acuticoccus sp. MNP-M23]WMS41182.1 phosphatidate cytidylyltransferase [Acuticoccus sp. MNP-M23]